MSGLIVEFIKSAEVFHECGYEIFFDLGYDIKADKYNFHKEYDESSRWLPEWIQLKRTCTSSDIAGYNRDSVDYVLKNVIPCTDGGAELKDEWREIDSLSQVIKDRILEVWRDLEVSFVMVENGTLPENIIFTNALCNAIEEYGKEQGLDRFVMWRDHDLMWWSEPGKYGEEPYLTTPRLRQSPYIQYVVLHDLAKEKLSEWSPGANVVVLPNTFDFSPLAIDAENQSFRQDFGIPEDALLIGRCTRIIVQKRIDRDIDLLARLNRIALEQGLEREIHLFVAGNVDEDKDEFHRLKKMASELGVGDRVTFGNELRSHGKVHGPSQNQARYSIADLLSHCQLNSFLTSYDYEGFGNPIGESVASGVPYITTSYELYDSIYRQLGLRAPVLGISEEEDGLADENFVREVYSLLTDDGKRDSIAHQNYRCGQEHLALTQLENRLKSLFSL